MTEQDKPSSQDPVTPGTEAKKQPVAGAAIENREVKAGTAKTGTAKDAAPTTPKPLVESTLVGQPGASARPAAAAKPPMTDAAPPKATTDAAPPKADDMRKATPATTQPIPAASQPPRQVETRVEVRRGGFFPTFLGGVVAAGIGAAACYWAIPHLPANWQPGGASAAQSQLDAARQAGTDAAQAELQAQSQALDSRAAEAGADAARQVLADAPPAAPAVAAPVNDDRIVALEQAITQLNARAAQQPAVPPTSPSTAAVVSGGVSQSALDELSARVNQQQTRIDELAARPTVDPSTAQQVQALAQQAQELQQTTEAANRRAQAATAAAALQAAIENAAPRDQALAELSAAGVQVPEVLTGDIPRLDQLRAGFPAAARNALQASMQAVASEQGAMDKIGNFLRVQTGARSVEPREGDDPDAILSRANAAVEAGDIQGALDQIAALPQPGQQAIADWSAQAKLWVDANAALATLASGGQ